VHTGGGEDALDLEALAARRLGCTAGAGAGQAVVGLGHGVELSLVVSCLVVFCRAVSCSARQWCRAGGSEGWGSATIVLL
jgi:hypothetical protein